MRCRITFSARCMLALLAVVGVLGVSGCERAPEIRVYSIPKPEAVWAENHVGDKPRPTIAPMGEGESAEGATDDRIFGAIIPHKDLVWFFKLSGPNEKVTADVDATTNLIKAVTFGDDGKPKWTLPEGWKQKPGSEFRFATLVTPAGMEVTVSSLPLSKGPYKEQLLDNVNRWRGQLQQEHWSDEELAEGLTKIEAGEPKHEIALVNMTGRLGGGSPMGAGAAPFAHGAAAGPAAEKPAPPANAPPGDLKYATPEGWKVIPPGPIAKLKLEVASGESKLGISVTDLPTEGNGFLENINRWRGQVGLPETTEAELAKQVTPLKVFGVDAKLVKLDGPGKATEKTSILGVVAVDGPRTWFVKLLGPTDLAEKEAEHFRAFAESLKQ